MENRQKQPLLKVEGLKKYYTAKGGLFGKKAPVVRAVDGVSFELYEGETLGLVGESGCGKSTLGRQIVGLERPDAGKIWYRGRELASMSPKEKKQIRTRLQMVFQDSYSSLNPRKHIYEILAEPMLYHGLADKKNIHKEIEGLLELVGLPKHALLRYPHEFSGGQRQRIGIAKALSLKPDLLVCDEPVSALDVSIQAQILNLLKEIQEELHLTCIFIGHGLGAVNYVSHRIAVMYLGRIVELADSAHLFEHPLHPYSRALFQAVPAPDPRLKQKDTELFLEGEVAEWEGRGCPFYLRCPCREENCRIKEQVLTPVCKDESHAVACTPALMEAGGLK